MYIDRPVATTVTVPAPANNIIVSSATALDTYNVTIRTDADSNTIINWDNNVPTMGEVVFGRTSQFQDSLPKYSYDFTTGQLAGVSAHHEVNLGKLTLNQQYYMRVISRTATATDITPEITYIPVPGKHIVPQQSAAQPTTVASASATLSFNGTGMLLLIGLVIVILLLLYLISRRRSANRS